MKIAHLILAHSKPQQLSRLIASLIHENAYFFIHIDKKTLIDDFLFLKKIKNLHFIEKRVKVYWGEYSIVQATINSFEEILNTGIEFGYVNLLSGQDYPVRSTEFIHNFLANNSGKAFMHYLLIDTEWREAIPRVTKYYFSNAQFPGKHRVEKILNTILPNRKMPIVKCSVFGKKCPMPDGDCPRPDAKCPMPKVMIPVGRSQWFTVNLSCVDYIVRYLNENPKIESFFKWCWAPDEMIFQTILYNSPFKEDMVNENYRYLDWAEGTPNPKVLKMEDADAIINSGKLFARKFNADVDGEILNFIDNLRKK